jgi:DNA-binding SARP family transcriptional activator
MSSSHGAEAPLCLRLLGPFEARCHGTPLPRLRSRKGLRILALLVLRRDRPVERAWLAGALWPDSLHDQALSLLRRDLTDLRRALGAEAARIQAPTPRTLSLDLAGTDVDLVAFDVCVARGDEMSLRKAVACYRGPLLEGWADNWLLEERAALEQACLAALESLARYAAERGEGDAAERYLRRAVAVDPLRESAHRALMQRLADAGRFAAALRTYRDLRLLLHRELNAAPDPLTTSLFDAIRMRAQRRPSPTQARLEAKSVALPVYELPRPLTRFIGRDQEIAAVRPLLAGNRLVTLVGVGGCGKTRLALQIASELAEAVPDGVCFVELAPIADAALLPQAVARALQLGEEGSSSVTESLKRHLRSRALLLVLDNCEHLIEAAAALSHALLTGCPHLRILATSREPLGIAGEQRFSVPPLSLPAAGPVLDGRADVGLPIPARAHNRGRLPGPLTPDLRRSEAVELFVDRTRALLPHWA